MGERGDAMLFIYFCLSVFLSFIPNAVFETPPRTKGDRRKGNNSGTAAENVQGPVITEENMQYRDKL